MLDGGEDGEHSGIHFVEVSRIFMTHDAIFHGTEPPDDVKLYVALVERVV